MGWITNDSRVDRIYPTYTGRVVVGPGKTEWVPRHGEPAHMERPTTEASRFGKDYVDTEVV